MSKLNKRKRAIFAQAAVLSVIFIVASFFFTSNKVIYLNSTIPKGKGICDTVWTVSDIKTETSYKATQHGLPIPYMVERPTTINCDLGSGKLNTVLDVTFRNLFVDFAIWFMLAVGTVVAIQALTNPRPKRKQK